MPLLSRRRSALDVRNNHSESEDNSRPSNHLGDHLALPDPKPPNGRPVSEYGHSRSRLSHEVQPEDIPEPVDDDAGNGTKRFSLLKLRNFSESHLAARAKEIEKKAKEHVPAMPDLPSITPAVPAILTTAPTMEHGQAEEDNDDQTEDEGLQMKTKRPLFKRSVSKGKNPNKPEQHKERKSIDEKRKAKQKERKSIDEKRGEKKSLRWRKLQGRSTGLEDLQRHIAQNQNQLAPPSYGDETNSALAIPVEGPRMSESTNSEGSNASSDQIYGSTTTTTHTVSTHTTFFKLPRRNKNRNSLFPLPVKIPPPNDEAEQIDEPTTPRASTSALSANAQSLTPNGNDETQRALQRRHTESPTRRATGPKQSLSFAEPDTSLTRTTSERSRSPASSPLQPPGRVGMRDRASTASSLGRNSLDPGTPSAMNGSGRNSTSTTGRTSFGQLLNISRFRNSSDPHSPRHGSPGTMSKANSFAMSREALVVPEREEGDTPGKYLERLEAAVARSMIAGILSKSADPFAQAVLRSYTRRFPFFGEPIDMSLRKFLLEAELPKETQQVDRVIQAFADRYHECNPGIFVSPDQAYIVAFSLMMLHTDAFNKNNKRKMQKQDYIKNTSGQSVSDDILGCFYDNICYTPFVHYEEEVDINGERVLPFKPKKSKIKGAITDSGKKPKPKPTGPVDPYNLLVDQKLDMIRPAIKDSIMTEDPYNYRTPQTSFDPVYLQSAFTHTGVLQIISQRSRPTAYEGQLTNSEPQNPMEQQPGIIDIKITKVGTLWRKSAKKKKTRSPWNEWGAILTGSQLYMFKNAHWAKGLVHQFVAAQKHGHPRIPVVFKPPLQEFKPDALIKTDNAVALIDATYTRHKNAFTLVRAGGLEEVLLADNESELNDWLALINYAAAFRAAGVRIRGMVGGTEEDLRARDVRRLESTQSARSVPSMDSALTVQRGALSPQLQRQVMAARRQIMVQKIGEATKEIAEASKELEHMLRNARHLLVMAPIMPKTREDIIHAAAQADASIKWIRREIWRIKCHKDIWAMDVQLDGVSATEVVALAEREAEAAKTVEKARPRGLSRFNSKASAARSPPQSPMLGSELHRPSTSGSLETYLSNDVFRTPTELTEQQAMGEEFRIPPLQLDIVSEEQHLSSTLLSASSHERTSVSNASTMSSIRRVPTDDQNDALSAGRTTPTPSVDNPSKAELLARASASPEPSGINLDGANTAAPASTPESNKQKSVRRSLQKTLRDPHHHPHHQHGSQRHRRGKESESTIRSSTTAGTEGVAEESTPGLEREKGRFILHGKQASVVQFGNDWVDETMKQRRELWRQSSGSTAERRGSMQRPFSFGRAGWRADQMAGLAFPSDAGGDDGAGAAPDSAGTMKSPTFRADAHAADVFMSASATGEDAGPVVAEPESLSEASDEEDDEEFEEAREERALSTDSFDLKEEQMRRRETVLASRMGPDLRSSARLAEEKEKKEKRRTVIGPSDLPDVGDAEQAALGGAEEEEKITEGGGKGDGEGKVGDDTGERLQNM